MRVHISLDDQLVAELDRVVGARERSAFIAEAVRRSLADRRRRESLLAALGTIEDAGHDWDDDPAGWVRQQRSDQRRAG
jgi:metal-responsive CopG/Arc/MetJ family transcriptional regulator